MTFRNAIGSTLFRVCISFIQVIISLVANAQPGTLDSSFGDNGIVITSRYGTLCQKRCHASIILQQHDGKIIVAGNYELYPGCLGIDSAILIRYNQDGTLDTTFGSGGVTGTAGTTTYEAPQWYSMQLQNDGKIVVAGVCQVYMYWGSYASTILERYNSNGTLDNSFNDNGIFLAGDTSRSPQINIQPDGEIVLSCVRWDGANNYLKLMRFFSDGTLDNSFGNGGVNQSEVISQYIGYAMPIQSDGKILVSGKQENSPYSTFLVRFNSDGSIDSSFGLSGIVLPPVNPILIKNAPTLKMQRDGKIIFGGTNVDGLEPKMAMIRLNGNGSLDSTFGIYGMVVSSMYPFEGYPCSIDLQSDGKILVGGIVEEGLAHTDYFLSRYLSAGELDSSFGNEGTSVTSVNTADYESSITVQSDDKILMLGTSNVPVESSIVLLRYNTDLNIKLTYPILDLGVGTIEYGSTISFIGHEFSHHNLATLIVSGPIGFSQTIDSITTDDQGNFSYSFETDESMLPGLYSVYGVDLASGKVTSQKSFTLTTTQSTDYLEILVPDQPITIDAGTDYLMEWKDKLVLGSEYPVDNADRLFQYDVDYSADDGLTWNPVGTIAASSYIDSWIHEFEEVSFDNEGDYLLRVTDHYNPANYSTSANVHVVDNSLSSSVDLLWDKSWPAVSAPVQGVTADGTARIFLDVHKLEQSGSLIDHVEITLSDGENTSYTKLGRVQIAESVAYNTDANDITSTSAQDNESGKDHYYFWYVAPDDFVGTDQSDTTKAYRYVTANTTVTYADGSSETIAKQIKIVRPPLMLVHGLAGDPSAWNHFVHSSSTSFDDTYLNDKTFNVVDAISIDGGAHFSTNALNIATVSSSNPIGSSNTTIQYVVNLMRQQGYACNKVDYIGHSMGGSVLRYLYNNFPNAYYVKGSYANMIYKNYEEGWVHKFITLNTPHNGSPLADLVTQYTPELGDELNATLTYIYTFFPDEWDHFIGGFIIPDNLNTLPFTFQGSDAVNDLQQDEGINFTSTDLPSHLIAGDMFGTISELTPEVYNTLNTIPHLTEFLNVYYEYRRAIEDDPVKSAILDDLLSESPVIRGIDFLEWFLKWGFPLADLILDGDLVVPLQSQMGALDVSASNVSVFTKWSDMHLTVHDDIDVGNKVFKLLNAPLTSIQFGDIASTNNFQLGGGGNLLPPNPHTIVSLFDTNQVKILLPATSNTLVADSMVIITIHVTDTTHLKYTKLFFQGQSYYVDTSVNIINYSLQVRPDYLHTTPILATAVYDIGDTTLFVSDTMSVMIELAGSPSEFSVTPLVNYLAKQQSIYPTYLATYETYVTPVAANNPDLTISIDNTSIVEYDSALHRFEAVGDGQTFARIEYKELSDTIYFVVAGDTAYSSAEIKPVSNFTVSEQVTCAGTSLQFADSSFFNPTNWEWQFEGGNPSISNAANPIVEYDTAGLFDVLLVASNLGGSDTLQLENYVSVLPQPTVSIASLGSTEFCLGGQVTIVANSDSAISYQWQLNNSVIQDAIDDSLVVSESGDYSLIATGTNGCSSVSNIISIVVDSLPNVQVTPSDTASFCEGDSVLLSTTQDAQYHYQWKFNGTNIPGATNPYYWVSENGNYKVKVTTSQGCSKTSNSVPAIKNQLPTIQATANNMNVCKGDSVILIATGGQFYLWQPTNFTGDSLNISLNEATTFYVTGTDINGCVSYDTITVDVLPLPIVYLGNDTVICHTASLILDAGSGFTSYLWSNGETSETILIENAIEVDSSEIFWVQVIDSDGCKASDSIKVSAVVCTEAGSQNSMPEVRIYPNPNQGSFLLAISDSMSENIKADLLNMLGQVVLPIYNDSSASHLRLEINAGSIPPALYYLQIQIGQKSMVEKIMIEK